MGDLGEEGAARRGVSRPQPLLCLGLGVAGEVPGVAELGPATALGIHREALGAVCPQERVQPQLDIVSSVLRAEQRAIAQVRDNVGEPRRVVAVGQVDDRLGGRQGERPGEQ